MVGWLPRNVGTLKSLSRFDQREQHILNSIICANFLRKILFYKNFLLLTHFVNSDKIEHMQKIINRMNHNEMTQNGSC